MMGFAHHIKTTKGMEACSGAPHWARLFRQHGHTVKLMAPKFVTPYRMSGKLGKNDAATGVRWLPSRRRMRGWRGRC